MQMLQKYHDDDLHHLCATYEPENADNARMFGIWFDDKLHKVATNKFITVRRWQWCL